MSSHSSCTCFFTVNSNRPWALTRDIEHRIGDRNELRCHMECGSSKSPHWIPDFNMLSGSRTGFLLLSHVSMQTINYKEARTASSVATLWYIYLYWGIQPGKNLARFVLKSTYAEIRNHIWIFNTYSFSDFLFLGSSPWPVILESFVLMKTINNE